MMKTLLPLRPVLTAETLAELITEAGGAVRHPGRHRSRGSRDPRPPPG